MLVEEILRDSEEFHQLIFNYVPDPLWVYDVQTLGFLAVNDAALASYGHSREEFLAMTVKDIRPQSDIPVFLELLSRDDSQRHQVV